MGPEFVLQFREIVATIERDERCKLMRALVFEFARIDGQGELILLRRQRQVGFEVRLTSSDASKTRGAEQHVVHNQNHSGTDGGDEQAFEIESGYPRPPEAVEEPTADD